MMEGMICNTCKEKDKAVMVGQTLTPFHCAICGKIKHWMNNYTPRSCMDCSRKTRQCFRCGKPITEADCDLEIRYKLNEYSVRQLLYTQKPSSFDYMDEIEKRGWVLGEILINVNILCRFMFLRAIII